MARILYLVHRLPYPPNKGDKVRSYHLLRHLAERHEVYLGTFVDDPEDEAHVETLRPLCAEMHVARLHPRRARVASLAGLVDGSSMTLHYYRDAALARWAAGVVRRQRFDAAVVFSSSMAQYAESLGLPMLVDFVDVDSAKWSAYAEHHRWPMSWLYRREGERLLAYERGIAGRAARAFFVTQQEVDLFGRLAPESAAACEALGNGVDAEYFAPAPGRASPFDAGEVPLVFTGAMDYWPNIDAVGWFVREMLPALRQRHPRLRFHIVGRSPSAAVRELAGEGVNVTGTVPDVRPYLQHAAAVVAPLRLARGIQNKILEAMAMARPVVAARSCTAAVPGPANAGLIAADEAADYVEALDGLLRDPAQADERGAAARQRVLQHSSWSAHLAPLEQHLARIGTLQPLAA